jgi:membrane-associated phospholipid phosphatase
VECSSYDCIQARTKKLAKQLAGTPGGSMVLADGTTKKAAPAFIITSAAIFGLLFFSARSSHAVIGNWDRALLLWHNSFAADHGYAWELASNPLFRGFPIFFSLVALWFAGNSTERRSRMLAGLLATCMATVFSAWMQFHLATHTRPLLDPAIPLNIVDPQWSQGWDRKDSFPSDTATLFFALATVIFLENRLVGLICLLWAAVIIAIPRVIFGYHYPTDIAGSLALGLASVLLFNTVPYVRTLFERTLTLFERRMHIVHALLFMFLMEASGLFSSLQKLGKALVQLLG